MPSTREIRRRIKSIKNTRQITRAMEMVAASKMQKAVNSALASRNYSRLAWELITNLSQITNSELHPLLQKRQGNRILLVLATSDRGLCGMYNSNIIKSFIEFVRGLDGENPPNPLFQRGNNVDILVIGKKGEDMVKRLKKNIVASFVKFSDNPNILDTRAIAKVALDDYINNKYDKVYLAYTDYISTLRQAPKVKQLLPLQKIEGLDESLVGHRMSDQTEYLFEPATEQVLEVMLPRLVEMQIYQAILESKASEHSSRMLAMKNASDGARDLIDDLTLTYNQARQSAITSELADIIGGRVASEK